MSQHRVKGRSAGSVGFSKGVEEIVQHDDYRLWFFFFFLPPFLYGFISFVILVGFFFFVILWPKRYSERVCSLVLWL